MNFSITSSVKKLLFSGLILAFSLFIIQACDDDDGPTDPPGETGNIVEVAQSDDDFSMLVSLLKRTDLRVDLQADGPFTVFAPTNDAIDELPEGTLASLSDDQLKEVLNYHIIAGTKMGSGDLQSEQPVETVSGDSLYITVEEGEMEINDNATVINADIEASNGVIHAIDEALIPDSYLGVAGIIAKRYDLETTEEAVEEVGLTPTLMGDGPFTVFAPKNAAFDGINLAEFSQQQLEEILTYHVLPDEVLSGDLSSSQTVTTVNGAELDITVTGDGTVSLTDQQGKTYQVVQADLKGTNGVVHIIDGVLMPS